MSLPHPRRGARSSSLARSPTIRPQSTTQRGELMAKEPRSLRGKVVASTGGARGTGKATANPLAHDGAGVAVGDLDAALADRAAGEIGGDAGGRPLDESRRGACPAFPRQ